MVLIGELTKAGSKLHDTFQDVSTNKMQHEKSHSKKENERKLRKRKEKRDNSNSITLLKKIAKVGIAEKCFPSPTNLSKSCYAVKITDVRDGIDSRIRPQRDLPYLKIPMKAGTFTDTVVN